MAKKAGEHAPNEAMNIISWNCRGLAATATINELKGISKKYQSANVFLMETRASKERIEHLRRSFKFQFSFTVDPNGSIGGLCLL